jgi:hypothetical protein
MSDLATTVEKAFDYRGDVTVHLKDGKQVVGYVFNREAKGNSRCKEPYLEVMVANSEEKPLIKLSEVAKMDFTGEDTAAGKSWEEWTAKEEAKNQKKA